MTHNTWPSLKEVNKVIGLENEPVLRNLLITQCYHDLSIGQTTMVGSGNVSWCTFATWASKTAGSFIRMEEISDHLRAWFGKSFWIKRVWIKNIERKLTKIGTSQDLPHHTLLEYIEQAISDVSADIAAGNLKVFAELAPIFSEMLDVFGSATSYDEAKVEEFVGRLRAGPSEKGGQDNLKNAIRALVKAQFENDVKKQAEWIFISNSLTGLHEQIRLQPYIKGSLDAPIEDAVHDIHDLIRDSHTGIIKRLVFFLLDLIFRPLIVKEVEKFWEWFATRMFMKMVVPGQTIYLGRDVPKPPGGADFPPPLRALNNPEAVDILKRFGVSLDSLRGTEAENWAELNERMGFIAELFRSRQQDKDLFKEPFSASQRDDLIRFKTPAGPF